ncbi:MFS transporter [Sulfolobus sp. S-194]|uniref:MFS transporter n=1 Tax=Sulfolobus sp. S-194 TaxID=2512240 RepID=UPI001436D690|nr:MFS transporter [Sulfolobus sp. S-194]QIW23649.1 MFS transporter [Sulfolobus sp. S-194]
MNSEARLASSWFIWGLSYYLYYPFVSLFAVKFVQDVTILYLISTAFAIPMPLIGSKLARKIGLVKTMMLGGILSGIGLVLFSFSTSLSFLIISYVIASTFFISLPSYYSYMNNLGKGTISKIWAISIIPSLFTPFIGGIIASVLGLRAVFLIGGILMTLTALPLISLKEIQIIKDSLVFDVKLLIPIVVILPIALAFPFIYLVLKQNYSMSYENIGLIATLAEMIGAFFTFLYSKFARRFFLSLYLVLFSLIYLIYFNPMFALFFGLWEAIIPSALEESKEISPEAFGIINSFQQVGWFMGYLFSYLEFSIRTSILISSLISVILGFIFLVINKR